jgi:hypothetical protein
MSITIDQLKQSIGTKAMYPELALKMSADKDNKESILETFMKSLTDEEFNFLIYNVLAKGKTLKNVRISATFETADEELNWIIKTMPSLEKHKEELKVNLVSYRRKFGLNT